MISSEQINLRLADRCHEGDPRTLPRTYAHHGVRARVDGRAVSTSMIHGPTVDEQAYSVSGVPHDLYAVQIRQIKDDALVPNGTHYKIPSGEGVGMIKLHLPYPPGREQRGRDRSLSPSSGASGRNASAAGTWADHPRENCGCFDQDPLLLSEGPDRIPRNLNGLMAVMRHLASLQGGAVHYVAVALRPPLKKIDGIVQVRNLSDQVLLLL